MRERLFIKPGLSLLVSLIAVGAWGGSLSHQDDAPAARFGRLVSERWRAGQAYQRKNLMPVANLNREAEPQPTRAHPFDVVVGPAGRKVYIGLLGSELEPGNSVAVYDVSAQLVIRRIPLSLPRGGPAGSSPYRLGLHPGGKHIVVTNRFSNFASVIDVEKDEVVSEIPLDYYAQGMAFSHDGRTGYFASRYLDQVLVADVRVEKGVLQGAVAPLPGGPGIPVGNPRSKPKIVKLSKDGRHLFVGNTGTQDISIVDTQSRREIGSLYIQNVVNDIALYHSPKTGREYLLASTGGAGFGVARERDPFGGESWDRDNAAAHFSVQRAASSGRVLEKGKQRVLGPFDAVDGTAGIKFRDVQNDIVFIDLSALEIPHGQATPRRLLRADRYEAHRTWVRYTSDTAESVYGDIKGDIPPALMRVVGALPEKMALSGDRLYVTMQGSNLVQEWRVVPQASDPVNRLEPVRTYATGMQPIGIGAGRIGTPSEGKLFVANFLGGSLSVIDLRQGESQEIEVDPSLRQHPVPDTNAERGEIFAHTALFSSDGDTSCIHCHYLDMGDGRPWGVSQLLGQEYLAKEYEAGQFVIGGTMGVPQMRALAHLQPFFYEGTLSVYEPRSMIMEHAPADDFRWLLPREKELGVEAHYTREGVRDVQSSMGAAAEIRSSPEERRDEMFKRRSMRYFGKAFSVRDFQRFVGEWQAHEPRLLPNPYDRDAPSVRRGEKIFQRPRVGCVSCHPPPHFAKKDLPDNPTQTLPAVVSVTSRDAAFTLIGMNRLDAINGEVRDLDPDDKGRIESGEGRYATTQLRGLWDRPPVFLHGGTARTLREVLSIPGQAGLRIFKYPPLLGGEEERVGGREIGFNATAIFSSEERRYDIHREAGIRIGVDTHGGTSHLSPRELEDLIDYLRSIE